MTKYAMVVDDSVTIRNMLSFTLTNEGFEVTEAEDGVDALKKINNKDYNLFIVDINMPNMNGFELMREIRKIDKYKKTPLLVLTTEGGDDKKAIGREAGANGWIVKPFNPEQLVQIIKKICI